MTDITSTALSGLNAASTRLQVSANNVANANSYGALPTSDGSPGTGQQAYQPGQVSQSSLSGFGGVTVSTSPADPAYTQAYDPQASYANDQGMVANPNVNYATEAVNQVAAVASYQANAMIIKIAGEMQQSLLDSYKASDTQTS